MFSAFCINLTAQTECATIAEIKSQADGTYIVYKGTAKTTFYNGTSSGLFMEDETGGILLKGYTPAGKAKKGSDQDWITDSMSVTNVYATWKVGTTGTAPGLTIAKDDKQKAQVTFDVPVVPTEVPMADFIANPAAYEGKAIIITDAKITKDGNKYYLDSILFLPNNVSSKSPSGGDMAGVYLAQQYNRFLLCSAEFTKAKEFFSFTDMSAYYYKKDIEIIDAKVDGAVLVNYVTKVNDTTTAILAQYMGVTGLLPNGITIFVNGETTIAAGDSIDGMYGKYTDAYKNNLNIKDFKGAFFTQSPNNKLNIRSSNNPEVINTGVNISDLLTNKVCMNYAAQIISSRYTGKLYAIGDKYYFKITYEQSNPSEDADEMIQIVDSIRLVQLEGVDLSKHVGNNIIVSGVYDARVIYDEPTLIIRTADDILVTYYSYNTISEIIEAGEPLSTSVVYGLNSEVVVNYKLTQVNSGVSQTWAFIEDETGVLALDLGSSDIDAVVGDKIKGLKGSFDDGVRYGFDRTHAPIYKLSDGVVPEIVSSNNELNVLKASLKEVIQDTVKYCSHMVEISNVNATFQHHSDFTGETDDYYIYDSEDSTYTMHYTPGAHINKDVIGVSSILGENFTITALINFNCLDGYYVFYATRIVDTNGKDVDVDEQHASISKVYTSNNSLYIETECGSQISTRQMPAGWRPVPKKDR